MKYLNPTADLTFKRVFGEHPDLMISLLNAMLPLDPVKPIVRIEYLTPEMVPENPAQKDSLVDVRCFEPDGRQFIVEMQMEWTTNFMQRVLFNASKAYVKQLDKGQRYESLQPVYALSFVNAIFEPKMKSCYHHYALVHRQDNGKLIDGLQLVFIELPKFEPRNYGDKKMQVLWLRFLTEINENTKEAPAELLADPEVNKALDHLRESAFTPGELYAYDKYWDFVSRDRTLSEGKWKEGMEIGEAKGRAEEKLEMARKMKALGMSVKDIAAITGLDCGKIEKL